MDERTAWRLARQVFANAGDDHAKCLSELCVSDSDRKLLMELIARQQTLSRRGAFERLSQEVRSSRGSLEKRFELQEEIGRGSLGVVYQAKDKELGRLVALKILHRMDDAGLDYFKNGARLVANLRHPGICTVFDFGVYDGLSVVVMELVRNC